MHFTSGLMLIQLEYCFFLFYLGGGVFLVVRLCFGLYFLNTWYCRQRVKVIIAETTENDDSKIK